MTNAKSDYTTINISVDHVWAGSGKLRGGIISDCGAQFCGDAVESEEVYEFIEAAITGGKDSLRVELSDREAPVTITWSLA